MALLQSLYGAERHDDSAQKVVGLDQLTMKVTSSGRNESVAFSQADEELDIVGRVAGVVALETGESSLH